ncbi:MATE family efflux transporter [bacterium]|nr:MATE family efflux transporter [bacterium]
MLKIFEYKYIKELFTLAIPIIMGNLGHIMLGAVDCFVAGRYSTDAIAAISIATSIHATLLMFGIGLTVSISPLLSNKRGAKECTKKYFFPSLKFALLMGIGLMFITLAYIPALKYLGYEQKLLHDVELFTFILAFSTIGAEINVAIKEFLQSYEIVFLPNFLLILSVFLDLVLNYIFVYGLFGFPAMGVAGIAISTTLIRTVIAVVLLSYCFIKFHFKKFKDHNYYKQIFKMGLPISAAIIIEFTAFNYIAIMLGKVSGLYAAAHNIILVISSTSFMIPMGISNALAVKVGYSNGAKNYSEMIQYIKNGIGISILFMSLAAIVFVLAPEFLIKLFTSDAKLVAITVPVMYIVAAFQITDGMQTSLSGIFKGLKQTKFVMISNFISYLIIGISLGTYLGIIRKMYLTGCWVAIGISSVILTLILLIGLILRLKRLKREYCAS